MFAFTVEDMADDPNVPIWTLARRAEDQNLWLMPDFGLWRCVLLILRRPSNLIIVSWDLVGLGPFDEIVSDMIANETTSPIPWANKNPQLGMIIQKQNSSNSPNRS